jgi:hypothetical protein
MLHYNALVSLPYLVLTYFILLVDDISLWSLYRGSFFVFEHKYLMVFSEETVNIFECSVRRFGVE